MELTKNHQLTMFSGIDFVSVSAWALMMSS